MKAWTEVSVKREDAPQVADYQKRRERLRAESPLPDSAKPFSVEHHRHGTFTYPSFEDQLANKMLEPLMVAVLDQVRKGESNLEEIFNFLLKLELQVRTLYRDVVEKGVPVFRDFVDWVEGEFQKAGSGYAGEFYVGRDIYTTLYEATKANRWGRMPAKDVYRLTAYVNVSRRLLSHMNETKETRAMMKTWLEQAGITRQMYGVDGGYSGSGPLGVFQYINPDSDWDEMESTYGSKIKLIESHYRSRLFHPKKSYASFVTWMEVLPKYTDRSEQLIAGKHGKYFADAVPRSAAERTLAWTVKRAVWREFVNYKADPSRLETSVQDPVLPVESDPLDQPMAHDDTHDDYYDDYDDDLGINVLDRKMENEGGSEYQVIERAIVKGKIILLEKNSRTNRYQIKDVHGKTYPLPKGVSEGDAIKTFQMIIAIDDYFEI